MEQILAQLSLKNAILRLTKGTTYIVLLRLAALLLGISSIAILARVLPPDDLGVYFILLQFGNIATLFCMLGTDQGNQKFISKALVAEPETVYEIFKKLRKILLLASSVTLSVLLIFWELLETIFFHADYSFTLYIYQAAITLILSYQKMQASALRAVDMLFKSSLSEKCFQNLLFFITLFLLFLIDKKFLTLKVVLLLFCLSGYFSIVISFIWISSALRPYKKISTGSAGGMSMKEMVRLSVPMGVATGSAVLRTSMDLLIVSWFLGPSAAGLYGPIKRVINFVVFLLQAINKMLSPIVATLSTSDNREAIEALARKGAAIGTYFSVPLSLLMIILGKQFLVFSFGPSFEPLAPVLTMLLIGHVVRSTIGSPGIILQMMGKEYAVMVNNVMLTLLTLGLMLLVVKPFGLLGISGVSSGTLIVQYLYLSWLVYKTLMIKTYMSFITVREIKMITKEIFRPMTKI